MNDRPKSTASNIKRIKRNITLNEQLVIPLIPFLIDFLARILFLSEKVHWYYLPDLAALMATFAFFCLGLSFSIKEYGIDSDDEFKLNALLAKRELIQFSLLSIVLCGFISAFKALNEADESRHYIDKYAFGLFLICCLFVGYHSWIISQRHITYVGE